MAERRRNDPYNSKVNYYPETQDVVVWQRFRDMVLREALNPAWYSELHRLHHLGKIDRDELLSAERYQREYMIWQRKQDLDPEFETAQTVETMQENKEIMAESMKLLGLWRHPLEDLVIRDMCLTEKKLTEARRAMILLRDLFYDRTKRQRKKT